MKIVRKLADSRSIIRFGAQLFRNGHETLEFFVPNNLPRESIIKIGARLPFMKHRNRLLVIDFVAEQKGLSGMLIVAHYKRNNSGNFIEA